MLSFTGTPLLVMVTAAAFVVPLLIAWWTSVASRRRVVPSAAAVPVVAVGVVLAQLVAILGVFLWVNHSYAFYASWDDLLGTGHDKAGVKVLNAGGANGSRTKILTLTTPAGAKTQMLAWLPRQYSEPAYAHKRFPVVVFLPGQPSTPNTLYRQYDVSETASTLIDDHKSAPFVVVIPPIMIDPPRDTECTDVPGGPQDRTFLDRDVPAAIQQQLRVQPRGPAWAIAGWSTGGFCAAKIGLSQPRLWSSVISLGGYYTPITDGTTGDLFHGREALKRANSPLWLYERTGNDHPRMLIVAGRQDGESWPETRRFLAATTGDPKVSFATFDGGAHNPEDYQPYFTAGLARLGLPAPQ